MAAAVKKTTQPELLSTAEIGRRLKLAQPTVKARLEDLGYTPDPSSTANNKLYPFDAEMEFEIKAAKDTASAMKIRDLRASAELKELKLAEARKELVPMGETIEISQKLVAAMYKEFAIHQPKRLAVRVIKCKTAAEVVKLMK